MSHSAAPGLVLDCCSSPQYGFAVKKGLKGVLDDDSGKLLVHVFSG